jgi:hypothetical protein
MPRKVHDLYSKRQKRLRGEPDVFTYDTLPRPLRVQVIHIFDDTLGDATEYNRHSNVESAYKVLVDVLCREYGTFFLTKRDAYAVRDYRVELGQFILNEQSTDHVIDAIEFGARLILNSTSQFSYRSDRNAQIKAEDAIEELNTRFQEHAIGYRFESGEIVRIDSEVVHAEVVKPALALLRQKYLKGAEDEFLLAHEHHRHGRHKDALAECLKALESTMKAIAARRGWVHDSRATAKPLLDLMFHHELIPTFWAQHFSGLRATLESGVPTVRNRMGGHGQGTEVVEVPAHIAAFAIHQTAAAIVFLASAEGAVAERAQQP